MTWVKIDDRMPEHPKVIGLSDRAFRAHVEALCYCAGTLTDGFITQAIAERNRWARSASELVKAVLWEVEEGGWRIHDYLKHQRSKAAANQLSETRAAAGARGGDAKAKQSASKLPSKPLANLATRSEEIREEVPNPTDSVSKTRARAKQEPFTDGHRAAMHSRYDQQASPSEVDEQIDLALAHRAAKNTTRLDLYVNNWLRRSFEGRNGSTQGRSGTQVRGGYGQNGRPGGVAGVGAAGRQPVLDGPPRPTNGAIRPGVAPPIPRTEPRGSHPW